MALTPGELDRLLLQSTAMLAVRRRERGLRLNVPEATALIADAVCEWARDGDDLPTVRAKAAAMLRPDDVLPGVPSVVREVRVEARFDDGTRLVIVKDPFAVAADPPGPVPAPVQVPAISSRLAITNEAPTAIAMTSHIHLAEVNPRLRLDRSAAFGMRLAVPTGSTVWIDPAATIEVAVTPIRGERIMIGNTGVIDGSLDDPGVKSRALALLRACGYLDLVDGEPRGDAATADQAVAALMDAHWERLG
jgi:urease subunit gamma/beta